MAFAAGPLHGHPHKNLLAITIEFHTYKTGVMKDCSITFEFLIVLCCFKLANMMGEFVPFLFERSGVIFYTNF